MKTLTLKLCMLVLFIGLAHFSQAQWATSGGTSNWTGADPRISTNNPDLELNCTSTTGQSGIQFLTNGASDGYLLFEHETNEIGFTNNQVIANALITMDLDEPGVTSTANGFINFGPKNAAHLTSDGNEIQAKSGTNGNSSLFLNYWGGSTLIGTGNNTGDIRLGNNFELYVDNSANRVGIGTNTPAANLEVDVVGTGGILIDGNNTGDVRLSIENGGGTHYIFDDDTQGHDLVIESANDLNFNTNGPNQKMTIKENGLIGIGTDVPSEQLHIKGATTTADIRLEASAGKFLRFYEANVQKGSVGHNGSNMYLLNQETAGDMYITTTDDIHFTTGGSGIDVMIDQAGRMGVGTTAPSQDIHIADAGNVAGLAMERTDAGNFLNLFSGTTGNAFVYKNTKRFTIGSVSGINSTTPPAASAMYLYGTSWPTAANRGNVGIGTGSPASKLHVQGDIQYSGALISSDARLKSDVSNFNYGLNELMRINPVQFTYNGRGSTIAGDKHVGVIAQELQKVAPELVESYTHVTYKELGEEDTEFESQEEFLRIRDTEIKYMIINAVKEQQEVIQKQEDKIDALQAQNEEMLERLEALTTRMAELEKGTPTKAADAVKTTAQSKTTVDLSSPADVAQLEQNKPNPFDGETTINYTLPSDAQSANMIFHDLKGNVILQKVLPLGKIGSVDISADNLNPGMYSYTLVVDGKVVETKKMQKVH